MPHAGMSLIVHAQSPTKQKLPTNMKRASRFFTDNLSDIFRKRDVNLFKD